MWSTDTLSYVLTFDNVSRHNQSGYCFSEFQNVSVNASIFTLTAIAVDRYKAIIYPLRSHASKFRTKGSP
jgi:hypothetical protein